MAIIRYPKKIAVCSMFFHPHSEKHAVTRCNSDRNSAFDYYCFIFSTLDAHLENISKNSPQNSFQTGLFLAPVNRWKWVKGASWDFCQNVKRLLLVVFQFFFYFFTFLLFESTMKKISIIILYVYIYIIYVYRKYGLVRFFKSKKVKK